MAELNPFFAETPAQEEFRVGYLRKLTAQNREPDMAGLMDLPEDQPVALRQIFVPLRFATESMEAWKRDEIDAYREDGDSEKTISLSELLLKHPQVVVLGGPGSGKTTLTRWLSFALSDPKLSGLSLDLGRRIVVPFILRHYIDAIDAAREDEAEALLEAYCEDFNKKDKKLFPDLEIATEDVLFYLKQGWGCLVFDGIDELGSVERRKKVRSWLLDYYLPLSSKNYLLCTSRPAGYSDCPFDERLPEEREAEHRKRSAESAKNDLNESLVPKVTERRIASLQHLRRHYVAPFNEEQVKEFSRKWHLVRQRDGNEEAAREASNRFVAALEKHSGLLELQRRPVFITLMAHVHLTRQELPHSRVILF